MAVPQTARELRLWHWRKVMKHRASAKEITHTLTLWEIENVGQKDKYLRSRANQQNSKADWHLSAVVILNEFVSGTAEEDEALSKVYNYVPRRERRG